MRVAFNNGKTNHFNKIEHGIAIRHKDPVLDVFFALAALLFTSYTMNGTTFPSFLRKQDWYDVLLFPSKNNAQKPLVPRQQTSGTSTEAPQ